MSRKTKGFGAPKGHPHVCIDVMARFSSSQGELKTIDSRLWCVSVQMLMPAEYGAAGKGGKASYGGGAGRGVSLPGIGGQAGPGKGGMMEPATLGRLLMNHATQVWPPVVSYSYFW